jgi:hypothetical protein
LAITSPTSGGRSVGIVRSRTVTMEFSFCLFVCSEHIVFPSWVWLLTLYCHIKVRVTAAWDENFDYIYIYIYIYMCRLLRYVK